VRRLAPVVFLGALLLARPVAAASDEPPRRYYYFGYDYGTQSLFNPIWILVNRGYDVLQDLTDHRNILELQYGRNAANVARNLIDPFPPIARRGWGRFLREEIFPLSFTPTTSRWVPNYTLHLLGGGVTYAGLAEWFEDARFPWPRVFSAATVLAAGFLNETIENGGVIGPNTDALADLFVFDVGGIILFSFENVRRFFGEEFVVADWSMQPGLTFPHAQLHNQGNYFAAKWALPFYPRVQLFSYFGEAMTAGLSVRLDREYSLSAAAGGLATRLASTSTHEVSNVVTFAPTAAVFLDRRNSLLAALELSDVDDYRVHFNLYPHAIFRGGPAMGLWTVIDRYGRVTVGVSVSRLLGLGTGYAARR
jgi:hypothetical protein